MKCNKCYIEKDEKNFRIRKDRKKLPFLKTCNECINKKRRELRNINLEERRAKAREYYKNNKDILLRKQKEYQKNLTPEKKLFKNERVRNWYNKTIDIRTKLRKEKFLKLENKTKVNLWSKNYRLKIDQKKVFARYILNLNVKRKIICKPETCTICQKKVTKIEAHHPNYDEPLNVVWLCRKCHAAIHQSIKEASNASKRIQ